MNARNLIARATLLGLLLAGTSGCFLLGAGAGAGAAVYLTDRGASSLMDSPLEVAVQRTRETFEQMRIEFVSEEAAEADSDIEIKGRNGPLEITVDLERKGPNTTLVEVSARRERVAWNQDYAKLVLSRIVGVQ